MMIKERQIWNEANRLLEEMQKLTDMYIADKDNVPKPNFTSAVALIVTIGDEFKYEDD